MKMGFKEKVSIGSLVELTMGVKVQATKEV